MILPKEFFEKIEYFEHSMEHKKNTTTVYDVFTIHFKAWWRRKRVIKIKRTVSEYNSSDGTFKHNATQGAADLHNQLNGHAIDTFEDNLEKMDKPVKKYEKSDTDDNVIFLKPVQRDNDNE